MKAVSNIEQLKEGAVHAAEQARNLSAKVGEKFDATYEEVVRGVRKIKNSAADVIEDTRHKIKENPLAVVSCAVAGAFLIGALTGYVVRSRRA